MNTDLLYRAFVAAARLSSADSCRRLCMGLLSLLVSYHLDVCLNDIMKLSVGDSFDILEYTPMRLLHVSASSKDLNVLGVSTSTYSKKLCKHGDHIAVMFLNLCVCVCVCVCVWICKQFVPCLAMLIG